MPMISARATLGAIALAMQAVCTFAQSPREQLNQLATELRANPANGALRERIIKLALEIKPAPAVPEEARRPLVQGNSAFQDAKSPEDLDRAIALYRTASDRAPWWPDPYFNLAKALEQRQNYPDAIAALKLYLLAAPDSSDTRQAQDRIYVLEEKVERAAKAATDAAAAQRAAEMQAAQRKQWAASLTQQLNAMFAGKLVRTSYSCTVGTTSLGGGATRDNGCTLQEYSGRNWTTFNAVNPSGVRFELSLDRERILFHEGFDNRPYGPAGEFPAKTGTPSGPTLDDISWLESDGKPVQLRFWTIERGAVFERSSAPVPQRSPAFNANVRYNYFQNVAR